MDSGGWDFNARQNLSAAVSALPPPCLNDVVHIIFGSTREIVIGDEFTVDFAKLGEGVCALLQGYVEAQQVKNMADGLTMEELHAPATSHPLVKNARATRVVQATAAAHVCGMLPGRVTIDGGECSVVAAVGRFHLLLDDAALSLWWMDADARACTWVPAPEPASPSRGEDRVTAEQCTALLAWLRRLDVSEAFAQPVLGVPQYDNVVHEPMHLGTMAQKLRTGGYATTGAAGFAADARLIHANATAFCAVSPLGADAIVYRMALVLRAAFEHKWGQVLAEATTRGSADADHARRTFVAPSLLPSHAGNVRTPLYAEAANISPPLPAPPEPRRLVHQRLEVFWPRDKMWYAALVTDYREHDGRHRIEYDDGHVEWLGLANPRNKYRVLGSTGAAADAPSPVSALISVQKLGIIVWAKSGAHPWWPAELCLPTATKFLDAIPPPRGPGGARALRQKMVIYFGDTQYDILDTASVVPFT